MNTPFGRKDFMVHRGATMEIEFSIRDNDRKVVPLRERTFVFNAINPENDLYVIRKPLVVKSYERGVVALLLDPGETASWPLGGLRYSISAIAEDERLMYMDHSLEAHGWFTVQALALPQVGVAVDIPSNLFYPVSNLDNQVTKWQAGPVAGALMRGSPNNLQTIAIYAKNYWGNLYLEGTLEDTPSQDTAWFPIYLACEEYWEFRNFTGIEAFNIEANVKWLRFTHIPATINQGSLDRILMNY